VRDPNESAAQAGEREAWLAALARDWRGARLDPPEGALCAFAEKLTRTPGAMQRADVAELRRAGFDDVAIHEAVQVIAYFNYINRVADAVHVDLEPGMPPYPEREGADREGA
jgi:uncharacterized peroxidase-related enzyme